VDRITESAPKIKFTIPADVAIPSVTVAASLCTNEGDTAAAVTTTGDVSTEVVDFEGERKLGSGGGAFFAIPLDTRPAGAPDGTGEGALGTTVGVFVGVVVMGGTVGIVEMVGMSLLCSGVPPVYSEGREVRCF